MVHAQNMLRLMLVFVSAKVGKENKMNDGMVVRVVRRGEISLSSPEGGTKS